MDELERRVLRVLASDQDTTDTDLGPAVEAYRGAGLAALERLADPWVYWRIAGPGHDDLLRGLATELDPRRQWWFLRKADPMPHLRVRVARSGVAAEIDDLLARWCAEGRLAEARRLVYEPELRLFGGAIGMSLAHDLFVSDTKGYTQWVSSDGQERASGRAALVSLALWQHAMRSAGLDRYELWDVWSRVSAIRPWLAELIDEAVTRNQARVDEVLAPRASLEAAGTSDVIASWARLLAEGANALAGADRVGELDRGLRAVLAVHITFHWNRLNLSAPVQASLARLAANATHPDRS